MEFARRLYDDGGNRDTVVELLQQDRRIPKKDAPGIARDAETRFFAERDLNYAVRSRLESSVRQFARDSLPGDYR